MQKPGPNQQVFLLLAGVLAVVLLLAGCAPSAPAGAPESAQPGVLDVVTTTTLVADVVKNVGGEHVSVTPLVPANVDEHGYEPAPRDIARVAQADVVFINGAGLEPFIERLVQGAGEQVAPVSVSEGITLLEGPGQEEDEAHQDDANETGDPHVWTDPNNVLVWVDNIEKALSAEDPAHAADYQKNAAAYRQQLTELDAWTREQVEQVPAERRKLVTDHLVFTYFADRYGFEQIGAVVPGYSTLSSPSAQQLAALEDSIRAQGVPAIFVGNTVSPELSERVAQDTGTQLVQILTGSLTGADGPAPTYVEYVRYNVNAIVKALK